MEPVDYMGFIGRNPGTDQHIYIATGDSGNGITHGTIAGILLTDLIMGRKNPWSKLYDPSRVTLRATGEFLKENLNVAGQYSDWATGSEVDSYDQIPPGGGAIVRRGMKKIAVYRDDQGTYTRGRQSARISIVLSRGIRSSGRGTVRVTDRDSTHTDRS